MSLVPLKSVDLFFKIFIIPMHEHIYDPDAIFYPYDEIIKSTIMDKNQQESQLETQNLTLSFIKSQIIPHSQLTSTLGSMLDGQNYKYYEQYKKLLQTAYGIQAKVEELMAKKKSIEDSFFYTERNLAKKREQPFLEKSEERHMKRFRRTNDQMQRKFKCMYEKCEKVYGTEGSLQQHIRLKHFTQCLPMSINESKPIKIDE